MNENAKKRNILDNVSSEFKFTIETTFESNITLLIMP